MASKPRGRQLDVRAQIAAEAARIMVEGGIKDYRLGKRKAIERLRLPMQKQLPGNEEIEAAILRYQRLFYAQDHPRLIFEMRSVATRVMRSLADFKPRLVGPVLLGSADQHSVVTLHVFADPAEALGLHFLDRGIVHRVADHHVRWSAREQDRLPAYIVNVDEIDVEIVVFSGSYRRRIPLNPIDGKAMRRASLREVEDLLAQSNP